MKDDDDLWPHVMVTERPRVTWRLPSDRTRCLERAVWRGVLGAMNESRGGSAKRQEALTRRRPEAQSLKPWFKEHSLYYKAILNLLVIIHYMFQEKAKVTITDR